jgi:hypothetical protein
MSPVPHASAEYRAGGWNALHVSADAIVLTNVANIIHSGYVFHPSAGPVWALHTFYLVTMALMLTWYLRYARHAKSGCTARPPPRQQERWPVLPTRRFRLLSGLLRPASAMGTGLTRRPQRPRSRRRPPTNRLEPQE